MTLNTRKEIAKRCRRSRAAANQALFRNPNAPAKPIVARHAEQLPQPIPPYSSIIITECDDCGGCGAEGGKHEYEPCSYCNGSGKQAVLKNWLGEAFQIASGRLDTNPQREHLLAMRAYASETLAIAQDREAA